MIAVFSTVTTAPNIGELGLLCKSCSANMSAIRSAEVKFWFVAAKLAMSCASRLLACRHTLFPQTADKIASSRNVPDDADAFAGI